MYATSDYALFFLLVPIILFILLVIKISRDIRNRKKASEHWPVTTGKIISSTINRENKGKYGSVVYYPEIKYTYYALGKRYIKTVVIGRETELVDAQDALNQYHETIEVRYNPEDPRENVTSAHPTGIVF